MGDGEDGSRDVRWRNFRVGLEAAGADRAGKTPDPKVDLDRDGTNDPYVRPLTKRGRVDSPSAQVYEKPDAKSKKLASLPKGTEVYIVGRAGNEWLAIDHGKRTAFVSLLDVAD